MTLTDNTVMHNVAAGGGGGLSLNGPGNTLTGNLISQNTASAGAGAYITGGAAVLSDNTITFNSSTGVSISASDSVIQGNTIHDNNLAGVAIPGGTGISIQANSIYANGGLGIDLAWNGATANDPGDGDTGPNDLQNFPEIWGAKFGATTRVIGSLDSTPDTTFVIDFYANAQADPSGFGEGQRWLGSANVSTDPSGLASFDVTLSAATVSGETVTATATNPGDSTSEFSWAVETIVTFAPEADDDAYPMWGDTLAVPAAGVLDNDSDLDGDPLEAHLVDLPTKGTVILNTDGSFEYSLGPNFDGLDSFTYVANDGMVDSNLATVSITHMLYVRNTDDSGEGSFRWTIDNANGHAGADVIRFAIYPSDPGFVDVDSTLGGDAEPDAFVIQAGSALPALDDATGGTTIEARTQTTFGGDTNPFGPEVVLLGTGAAPGYNVDGLTLLSNNNRVFGLNVQDFVRDGIAIDGSSGNWLAGNYIGTDATGTVDAGNGMAGIVIRNGAQLTIIGTNDDGTDDGQEGNVISGNWRGLLLTGAGTDGNVVAGNFIGTNATGTGAIPNGRNGIIIEDGAQYNRIGTDADGVSDVAERNLISGNGYDGINISGLGTEHTVIAGNFIGTDITGTVALGNDASGVYIGANAHNHLVGGSTPAARNVISGNGNGVQIGAWQDHPANDNRVQGNYIGTDVTGTMAVPNNVGVVVSNSSTGNFIGTDGDGVNDATEGNLISGNNSTGVSLMHENVEGNKVAGNLIGVDVTGVTALGNIDGIGGSGGFNTIGTDGDGVSDELERNIISGNRGHGIFMGGTGNIFAGNYIGTDVTGTVAIGNGSNAPGMLLRGSSHHVGMNEDYVSNELTRNVVAGNSGGISLQADDCIVAGNFIGVDATGLVAMGNGGRGIQISGDDNIIGTNSDGVGDDVEGNVIANAFLYGIELSSDDNIVRGNLIGTDATGRVPMGNQRSGVQIGGTGNTIGGTLATQRNVIADNGSGVGVGGSDNVIQGNCIGTDITGTVAMGNGGYGVATSGQDNTIGGPGAAGNVIAFSRLAGVKVEGAAATGNRIVGNSIHSNGGLGIDLDAIYANGVTLNDPGDADTGPNNLQNFPEIVGAKSGTNTRVLGSLDSTADTTFTVDFYSSVAADPSGYGEGARWLGSATVTTDPSGLANFDVTVSGSTVEGEIVTATAADPAGNTSEFSGTKITVDNFAPQAIDDEAGVNEDGPTVSIDLTGNDIDWDGDDLEINTLDLSATMGTVTINADNDSVTYDPDGQFESLVEGQTAVDTFSYTISDGHGNSDTAIVTVTITGQNDAPVANEDTDVANEDGPAVTIDVLANDSDPDVDDNAPDDVLSVLSVTQGVNGGSVTNNSTDVTYDPNGAFEYLAAGETAIDTFTYTVDDGNGGSDTATVTVTITGQNDAPVVDDADFTIAENSNNAAIVGTVTAGDVDADDTLTFDIVAGNVSNAFDIDDDGRITVNNKAALDFETTPVFNLTVEVDDGNGGTDTAAVTVRLSDVETEVALVGGHLTITDIDGGVSDDTLSIVQIAGSLIISDPNNIIVTDIAGATGSGTHTVSVAIAGVSQITVDTLGGTDSLTVDLSGSFGVPIDYNAGASGGDSLTIVGSGSAAVLVFDNETGGSADVDGQAIGYTGLAAIDMAGADIDDISLSYASASSETITLSDDGTAGDDNSQIDSTAGVLLTFATPNMSLTVGTAAGTDSIRVQGLDAAWDADLNIAGDSDDTVTFQTNSTDLGGGSLDVDAKTIVVKAGLATTGIGSITAEATRNITVKNGATVSLDGGDLILVANQGATRTAGSYHGIQLKNATLEATGAGQITLVGRGGIATSGYRHGIYLENSAMISAEDGQIALTGESATGAGTHAGVWVKTASSIASTGTGDITVTGTGKSRGIIAREGSTISAASGSITLDGDSDGVGVWLRSSGTSMTTAGGDITVTGTGETSQGIQVDSGASVSTTGDGSITINGTTTGSHGTVHLDGASTSVTTVDGDITIVGTGGTYEGIRVQTGANVSSTGSGSIELVGTAGTSGCGVFLNTYAGLTTGSGDITIIGTGGTTEKIGNRRNDGILVRKGTTLSSTSGSITLTGTTETDGYGVILDNSSTSVTTGGDITATGTSGTRDGIAVWPGVSMTTTGTGNVVLRGTGGTSGEGIDITGSNTIVETTGSGSIDMIGSGTQHGIMISSSSRVRATGSGSIALDGTGGWFGVHVKGVTVEATGGGDINVIGEAVPPATVAIMATGLNAGSGEITLTSLNGLITHYGPGTDFAGSNIIVNGKIAPSRWQTGQTVVDGNLSLDSSDKITVDLDGTTAETQYDQIQILGTGRVVALGSSSLSIDLGFTSAAGDEFVIIDNVDSGSSVVGEFAGRPDGSAFADDGAVFHIFYHAGTDNNDVVLIVNRPPEATGDLGSTDEDTILNVAASGVLANDSDPDDDGMTVSAVNGSGVNVGTQITLASGALLTVQSDGSFSYDPNGQFEELAVGETNTDTFTYAASDGLGGTDTATVTITVDGVNDAPTIDADNASMTVSEGDAAVNTGTFGDVDLTDNVTITASVGSVTKVGTNSGTWSWSFNASDGPDQTQLVTITANDGNGGVVTTAFDLTVNNVAPTLALDPVLAINEDGMATLMGTISDPGTLDTFTLAVNWGDPLSPDNVEQYTFDASATGSQSFTLIHQYLDDNPTGDPSDTYTISVTVTDDDTGSGSDSETVTVNNVAPTLVLDPVLAIDEDGEATLTGTISDVGTLDTFTLDVNWGDPLSPDNVEQYTFEASATQSQSFTLTHQYLDDNPTGDPSNAYTVSATVTDDDTGTDSDTETVTVNNVAPTLVLDPVLAIDEDGEATLTGMISDVGTLDTFTLDINWGDPLSPDNVEQYTFEASAVQSQSFTLTHQYLDDNPTSDASNTYTINATVTDDDTGVGSDAETVTVNNVAPTLALDPVLAINEDGEATLTGTISDPGTLDTFTLDINWGDPLSPDNVEQYTFEASATGSQSFTLIHQYLDDNPTGDPSNTYTISVTVTDDDTGSGSDTETATVNNVAPTLVLDPVLTINEDGEATLTGTISDPGTLDTFTLDVNWGDPLSPDNVEQYTFDASTTGSQTFTLIHQYLDDNPTGDASNTYTISATVTDDDTGSGSDTETATVNNVAPTLVLDPVLAINEDGEATLTGTISDVGTLDTFTLDVDWGDPLSPDNVEQYTFEASATQSQSFTLTHQYLDDNPTGDPSNTYTISATVTDDDTGTGSDTETVTVNNVLPTVDAGADQLTDEGTIVSFFGSFTDPGTLDTHTITWDYGDGTPVVSGTLTPTHAFADDGTYTVTLTVQDDDGAPVSETLLVTVNNVAPTIVPGSVVNSSPSCGEAAYGEPVTVELDFNDPGFDNAVGGTSEDFTTTTIDWGDGIVETVPDINVSEVPGGEDVLTTGSVFGTHVYETGGIFLITMTVRDDDGGDHRRGNRRRSAIRQYSLHHRHARP